MRNYIVRVYRRHPECERLVAGIVEDIESGQKEIFQSFCELQSLLIHSIENGRFDLADGPPPK